MRKLHRVEVIDVLGFYVSSFAILRSGVINSSFPFSLSPHHATVPTVRGVAGKPSGCSHHLGSVSDFGAQHSGICCHHLFLLCLLTWAVTYCNRLCGVEGTELLWNTCPYKHNLKKGQLFGRSESCTVLGL